MNVVHLSHSDQQGGAARAASRLHRGLCDRSVDSRMLVQRRISDDPTVDGLEGTVGKLVRAVRKRLDELPLIRYPDRDPEPFSSAWVPERRDRQLGRQDPDLVHVHWVGNGFLHPQTLANIDVPVVWTLHDMWPFTGGCHYANACRKYEQGCRACPQLGSDEAADLAARNWARKRDAWADVDHTVVGPSQWLADCAADSALFADATVTTIPNGLDTSQFRPRPPDTVRSRLGIAPDSKLLCFGAAYDTPRKGMDLLYAALTQLQTPVEVVAFGGIDGDRQSSVPVHDVGYLDEKLLRGLYSDADLMVVPSRQEAFGQTASEALAAGTPVVAFDATGPRDIVDHERTGYLADPFDPAALAAGIEWVLADDDRLARLSEQARTVAKRRFDIGVVASQYHDLYQRCLST